MSNAYKYRPQYTQNTIGPSVSDKPKADPRTAWREWIDRAKFTVTPFPPPSWDDGRGNTPIEVVSVEALLKELERQNAG
jgi:hypothetical protein